MIIAMWQVVGENAPALVAEAKSDCETAGMPANAVEVYMLRPHKVQGGRVELWRGWAIVTSRYVEQQLLITAIIAEEQRLFQERMSSQQSVSSSQQTQSP